MATDKEEMEFPRTIGDRTFYTPDELLAFSKELNELRKEMGPIVKAISPGRKVSPKRAFGEQVKTILNDSMPEELLQKFVEFGEDITFRLHFKDGIFSIPAPKSRENGSMRVGSGRKITVDGVDYASAKSARDQLYPDMKGKSQNYEAIAKYFEHEDRGHTVERHEVGI